MSIISYAQNFEDVILWRALKHVARGFYIDIGAQDPIVDSVSLAFYEKGWRGVHVEPVAAYAQKLCQARPDETVVQAAIGTSGQGIAFWVFPNTGLSTGDPAIAAKHEGDNRKGVHLAVPCMRLSSLLSAYRNRDIHWLKIDVEGMEHAVIQSWRPAKARPWIVVVESTRPNSPEPSFAEWEPLLTKLGYEFVYFDGLNRFYLSREHPELKTHFGPGPNFFDDFALSGNSNAPFCARINAEAASLRDKAASLNHELGERDKKLEGLISQTTLLDGDLARTREALTASDTWAKSLEADVLARNEALAARDAELARTREALTASDAWAKSLEADVLARNEALAARDAELARTREALTASDAWAKSLEADVLARNEALAARDAELARTREALTASDAWAKSREADVLARNEALAARDAELARTREALTASDTWAKSLEADVLARNEALAAVYVSKSFRITAPLRSASRAARWFVRGSWAWLTLRPGSRPRRVALRLQMMLSPIDRFRTEIPDLGQDNHHKTMPANTSPTTTLKIFRGNHNTEALTDLSSSARSVYAELKVAIALHEGNR